MSYDELKILLDINDPAEVLDSIGMLYCGNWLVVCDDGYCHLFGENGRELDISSIGCCLSSIVAPVSLKKIVVPDCITHIGRYAFNGYSKLSDVTFSAGIELIDEYAFANCESLKSVELPSRVMCIGGYAFYNCTSLESIELLSGVRSIGECAFAKCESLKSINPSGVESIGGHAFAYCTSLKSIVIPSSVKRIYWCAFYDCSSLESIVFKGKTLEQVRAMDYYPWAIKDKSIIKCA